MAKRYEASLAVSSGVTSDGRADTAATLGATLRAFQNRAVEYGSRLTAERGATAGGQVEGTPKLRKGGTAFARAYNNAALRNYVLEQYADMEGNLQRIEDDSGTDPVAFRSAAEGARRGAITGALPEARGDITALYQRRIAEGTARITSKQIAQQKQTNRAVLQQGLDTLTDSISRKLTSGDPALMAQAEEEEVQHQLLVDGAVESGDITPAEGIVLRTNAGKDITRQAVLGQFEREMRQGDPVAFIGRVMTQPVENLADDEKQQLITSMYERLNRAEALFSEKQQLDTLEQKSRWAKGERDATVRALRREITNDQLARMVADDELDPAVGRTLSNEITSPVRGIDDQSVLFKVRTNLLAYSEDEIAGMGGLSQDTRADLILKRREESEGWKNDAGAQEALRRIDVSLGIPAGLGPQFQIAITEEKATAAARARSYFYDLVEATPEEERKAKYLDLAETAVKTMGSDLVRADLAKRRTALQEYQAAVGNPSDMNERERKEYDETVKRYTDEVAKLEAQLGR